MYFSFQCICMSVLKEAYVVVYLHGYLHKYNNSYRRHVFKIHIPRQLGMCFFKLKM